MFLPRAFVLVYETYRILECLVQSCWEMIMSDLKMEKKKTNDIIKASKHEGEKVTSKTCDFAVNFGFNIFVYKFIQPRLEMLIFRQNP